MGRVFSRDIKSKVEDREIRRVMGIGMDRMDIVWKTTEIRGFILKIVA